MIHLPTALALNFADLNGSILGRLNTFGREVIGALMALRDRQETRTVDWLGGQTNIRIAVGTGRVRGVTPCAAVAIPTGVTTTVPGIRWRQEGAEVVVESLTGLTIGTRYELVLFIVRE